jgi:D-3-phosphoglycerate dehydrogenase
MRNSPRWKVLNLADITFCLDVFETLQPVADVVSMPASPEILRENIAGFDAYFATLHARCDRGVLERAANLRVIATASTGLDHIDLEAARERGVEILSLKDDIEFLNSITATAEMTWALLLAVARRLPWSFAAACDGRWARDEFRGAQLSGKTLGVLGYGRLGRMTAEYGRAFGMQVLACETKPVQPAPDITMVDLPTLLRESDVLSVHVHLTPQNRGLLGRDELLSMKQGAILLNTSRGAIIDEAALLDQLQRGHLGGAGLDVIDGEWMDDLSSHPLIRHAKAHQNLVISPHTGGVTIESQRSTMAYSVAKLKNFLESRQQTPTGWKSMA